MSNIQVLMHQFELKYPLYTREALVNQMLTDNVITKDIAKRILSGESLFLIDNTFLTTQNNDFNITKIMGGDFNKSTNKNKDYPTDFNR